jgi:hypothetical protein
MIVLCLIIQTSQTRLSVLLQEFLKNDMANIDNGSISLSFNPFPADVANERHLGSALRSHFCDLTGKTSDWLV